jgi:hypothetical protein
MSQASDNKGYRERGGHPIMTDFESAVSLPLREMPLKNRDELRACDMSTVQQPQVRD